MKLLEKYTPDGNIQLTTDPLVTYDWLVETYLVKIDDKTVAEIYGGNRGQRAKELALLIRDGQFGEYNKSKKGES